MFHIELWLVNDATTFNDLVNRPFILNLHIIRLSSYFHEENEMIILEENSRTEFSTWKAEQIKWRLWPSSMNKNRQLEPIPTESKNRKTLCSLHETKREKNASQRFSA